MSDVRTTYQDEYFISKDEFLLKMSISGGFDEFILFSDDHINDKLEKLSKLILMNMEYDEDIQIVSRCAYGEGYSKHSITIVFDNWLGDMINLDIVHSPGLGDNYYTFTFNCTDWKDNKAPDKDDFIRMMNGLVREGEVRTQCIDVVGSLFQAELDRILGEKDEKK